ncbi:MAG: DUF2281 domain-containing protein [Eggerthellaceae bacterium]|nr:DUF2281 domain-containing protein [Eggerthellaceae bacterium]
MTYATLEKQLKLLPEECMDEVSSFVDYLLFRQGSKSTAETHGNLAKHFGALKGLKDGLAVQKGMRSEWN